MVELQILNHILKTKSLDVVTKNNVPAEYFIQYKNEFDFIDNHYCKYAVIPDTATFLNVFADFEILEVNETDEYLVSTLQEQFAYSKIVPYVKKIAELCQTDANAAAQYAGNEIQNIRKLSTISKPGTDIVKTFEFCSEEYKRRMETEGLLGITSGLDSIDKATHGWMYPDVIGIGGRLNEGKSWLLFLFLINAWAQGHPVLLYSGEMDTLMLQMRMAALHGHFSNLGIMSGNEDLLNGKTFQDFFAYAREMSGNKTPFIVLTPSDLKTQKLTIPELRRCIEIYGPALIGIDQISLMEDYRAEKGQQLRISYTHISEDLYVVSEDYKIPVLVATQVGRVAAQESKKDGAKAPDADQVSESDGIAQNLTRLLMLKQVDNRLLLALRKNRYGLKNQEWKLKWNVDTGDIGFLQDNAPSPVVKSDIVPIKAKVSEGPKVSGGEEYF